jgi:hypothetical protein
VKDFLLEAKSAFLIRFPAWKSVGSRGQSIYCGRTIADECLVYVRFSGRKDREMVFHSVGWASDWDRIKSDAKSEHGYPKPRDGSLRRIMRLENPRDFEYDAHEVSIRLLHKPTDGFDLNLGTPDSIVLAMLEEVEAYAFPYLCLMLKKRLGIEVDSDALGHEPGMLAERKRS